MTRKLFRVTGVCNETNRNCIVEIITTTHIKALEIAKKYNITAKTSEKIRQAPRTMQEGILKIEFDLSS